MGKSKDPYTGFNSELAAPTFTDRHGNVAGSPAELAILTKGSDYIEKQFERTGGIPCGNCEQLKCVCPEQGCKEIDLQRNIPGKNRAYFCG
jgi:hypothetical protein